MQVQETSVDVCSNAGQAFQDVVGFTGKLSEDE